MSNKDSESKNPNLGKKFIMFVKKLDNMGFPDESNCGWLKFTPKPNFTLSIKDATPFIEKEDGHGSFSDWKKFLEEEHEDWLIVDPPKYLENQ